MRWAGALKERFLFRHAAPRNQHPRNRVSSSRRLREIDTRFGGSSAGCADEHGGAPQYAMAISPLNETPPPFHSNASRFQQRLPVRGVGEGSARGAEHSCS